MTHLEIYFYVGIAIEKNLFDNFNKGKELEKDASTFQITLESSR